VRAAEDKIFGAGARSKVDCSGAPDFTAVPPVPTLANGRGKDDSNVPVDYWKDTPALTNNMLEVVRTAFACDLTRVAALSIGFEGGNFTGGIRPTWLGINAAHHALSHFSDPQSKAQGARATDWRVLNRWFASQVALAVDKLRRTPYGTGTLLDQTIVYWFTRHGDGYQHDNHHLVGVLAGGAGGYFRMGRNLKLPPTNVNQLLISLAHAMGVEIKQFGVGETVATAPIGGLT
jgi:hypothetical protein